MAKIKSLFRGAKTAADRASRRVGAAGGKAKREGDDVYSVADPAAPGGRRRARGAAGAAKSGKTDEVKELTTRGRKRIAAAGAAGAGAATLTATRGGDQKKPSGKKKEKDYTKGVSRGGVPFDEAFAKARKDGKKTFTWNDKKYTTELASEKKKSPAKKASPKKKRGLLFGKDAKIRPFGGAIARALLGEDEKFGGDRGAIDFIRPKKKSNGGEMKKKGYAMGGAAMKSKMASKGGAKKFPDLTGDGKVTQADILKGRGVKKKPPGMMGGGMMKSKMASKGGKMGGKIPPGMKKGGSVKAKAPARKKVRGVGAAKRGFGKAMR